MGLALNLNFGQLYFEKYIVSEQVLKAASRKRGPEEDEDGDDEDAKPKKKRGPKAKAEPKTKTAKAKAKSDEKSSKAAETGPAESVAPPSVPAAEPPLEAAASAAGAAVETSEPGAKASKEKKSKKVNPDELAPAFAEKDCLDVSRAYVMRIYSVKCLVIKN